MTTSETGQFTPPAYMEALSLYCAPYEDRLDPKFFYASTALMQRLDLLTHLTQFGESVVVVTGPPGSGKTTLMNRFVEQANSQWRLCLIDGGEIEQLAVHLSRALHIDAAENENDLLSRWAAQTDASQLLVVVIDNAERLDQAACNRLCGLLGQAQGERVRIILFGSQDIQQRVKQALEERACSRTTQMLEVPRLSAEETSSYLMYRLAVAGYSGESPFTATEVRAICKAADGRPAEINRLAHNALADHQARAAGRPPIAAKRSGRHQGPLWLSASLGILVVAAYVGWQRLSSSLDSEQPLPEMARITPQQEIPLSLPEAPRSSDLFSTGHNGSLPASRGEDTRDTPQPFVSKAEPDASQQTAATPPAADTRAAENAPGEFAAATVVALHEPPAATAQTTAQQDAEQTPLEQPVADLATSEPELPAGPEQVAAAPTSRAEAGNGADGSGTAPHREDWLLQQPPKSYSLQLLGSRSEKSVIRFINDNGLDLSQTAYYRGNFKDSEWFVLLYGLYPTRDAALEAREHLPAGLRKGKPWPRSLESVHSAIREMSSQQAAPAKP
jgi:DamX protein